MPDNKTVTFDASQYQLVPKVPTQEMLDAASHASMQHFIDCLYDPEKAKEIGSEENVRKTHASRYQSMLTAAPTPAAQSAGQEAVPVGRVQVGDGSIMFIPDADAWRMGDEYEVFANAAPVNGGERTPAYDHPGCEVCTCPNGVCQSERAADAQQVGQMSDRQIIELCKSVGVEWEGPDMCDFMGDFGRVNMAGMRAIINAAKEQK